MNFLTPPFSSLSQLSEGYYFVGEFIVWVLLLLLLLSILFGLSAKLAPPPPEIQGVLFWILWFIF